MSRFPYPAYPNGWFRVSYSSELSAGEVLSLHYFGRELILFRSEEGTARVFDAYCPHLGAHLGHGGKVEGDGIRCPFHAWRFDGSGTCVEVPYAKRIPPMAKLKPWPVCEKNGVVFVYHHDRGEPPAYDVPELPQLGSDDWSVPENRFWKIRSRWLDMNENCVDQVHFKYIHGTPTIPKATVDVDGHIFRVHNVLKMTTPRGDVEGTLTTTDHGPGLQVVEITGGIDTLMLNTATPIDEETTDVSFSYSVKHEGDEKKMRVGAARIRDLEHQFDQDQPIWENKCYWERPVLCAEDGKFGEYRRWARQFFSEEY
jgi:nitrite reductase/ring-hydroxylating ferredoxin subunit